MSQLFSYTDLCAMIDEYGQTVDSERGPVKEITGLQLFYTPGLLISRKGMNKRLAMLEALMFCSGFFSKERIKEVAPKANHELYNWQSDYGPRTRDQLAYAVNELITNPNSRKAVIDFRSIKFNDQSQSNYFRDLACTTSMQFILRNNQLQQITTMRSCDLVYGFPMDIFMFGLVAQLVAMTVKAKSIHSCIQIGSAHIYDDTSNLAFEVGMPEFVSLTYRNDYDKTWGQMHLFEYLRAITTSAANDGALNDPAKWEDYKEICAFPFEFSTLQSETQLEITI